MKGQNSDVIMRKIMMHGACISAAHNKRLPAQRRKEIALITGIYFKMEDCFDNGSLRKNQLYSENLQLGIRGVLINAHFSVTQTPQLLTHFASLASGECNCALIVLKELLQLALY